MEMIKRKKIKICLVLCSLFVYSCAFLKRDNLNNSKVYLPELYFNSKNVKNQSKIRRILEKKDSGSEFMIFGYLSQNANKMGVYQYVDLHCDHCRTDRFLFYNKSEIIFLNDTLLLSRNRFKNFYYLQNHDTSNIDKLFNKITVIIKTNDSIKYDF